MNELFATYIQDSLAAMGWLPYLPVVGWVALGFVLLVWIGTVMSAVRDSRDRERGFSLTLTALILTLGLPLLGYLIYRIVRPSRTVVEDEIRELEHTLLSTQIAEELGLEPSEVMREVENRLSQRYDTTVIREVREDRPVLLTSAQVMLSEYINRLLQEDFFVLDVNDTRLDVHRFEAHDLTGHGPAKQYVALKQPNDPPHRAAVLVCNNPHKSTAEIIKTAMSL